MSDLLKIVKFLPGQSFFPPAGEEELAVAITNVSSDGQSITMNLMEFAITEVGPGLPSNERKLGYHFGVVLQQQRISKSSGLVLYIRGYVFLSEGVTAALTVLIGERTYQREFCGILEDDYTWRITYPGNFFDGKFQLPIVLMLSVNNQENLRREGFITCDSVDITLETLPKEDDVKETRKRLQRSKEAYRMRRKKKSEQD